MKGRPTIKSYKRQSLLVVKSHFRVRGKWISVNPDYPMNETLQIALHRLTHNFDYKIQYSIVLNLFTWQIFISKNVLLAAGMTN